MTVPVAVQESVHQAAPALAIMVTASVCRAATYAVVPCSLKNAVGQIVPAALKLQAQDLLNQNLQKLDLQKINFQEWDLQEQGLQKCNLRAEFSNPSRPLLHPVHIPIRGRPAFLVDNKYQHRFLDMI
ncbi:uncharacterized protein LOC135220026 isoform X1 [Macrobrachium nipponense]|uniref:uncharacterized protein LOC135220026 isoform X1 n=1 Tax=Macrobrachium nipponense TaxID=159736 RepID=UPI0030C87A24